MLSVKTGSAKTSSDIDVSAEVVSSGVVVVVVSALVAADASVAKTALTTRSTAVSDTVIKAAGNLYEVDEDIIVYTYTSSTGAWTVATGSSKLVSLKDVAIDFFDTSSTPDGIYEVAIIIK